MFSNEFTTATAIGVPPLGPVVIVYGISVWDNASLLSAAPTNPTGK